MKIIVSFVAGFAVLAILSGAMHISHPLGTDTENQIVEAFVCGYAWGTLGEGGQDDSYPDFCTPYHKTAERLGWQDLDPEDTK